MDQDPSCYIVLSLNTHLEVVYSTVHIFDQLGQICGTRVRNDAADPDPFNELANAMNWGGDALNDYYQDGVVKSSD